ncbi:Metallo-dependent phosphatase [Phellopilus nigrolimitatus]|nr:Metallo-dependent phosphatase [Phellopilus nigrolimitatus]
MLSTRMSPILSGQLRLVVAYLVLGTFVTYVLLLGISKEASTYAQDIKKSLSSTADWGYEENPEFEQYVHLRTLDEKELDFGNPERRVILVGDIHGMNNSLKKLLNKIGYIPSNDLLIHVGDIIAKGTHSGSLAVLSYMASHNITGVRGNHDQPVIEWRAWIDRVLAQESGETWLEEMEHKTSKEQKNEEQRAKQEWQKIPHGWEMMGDHYKIARAMSTSEYAYLLALPLVLHIPPLHAFIVHAGILPLDPRRSVTSLHQPLAHVPSTSEYTDNNNNVSQLRMSQERAVLADVSQNTDPWVLLNMRSILKDNTISKESKRGSAWAPLWNAIVTRCGGFNLDLSFSESEPEYDLKEKKTKQKPLPCHPSTVVYGHAASRGLDIKRWTKGLDSGCVYGRRLTALVLSPPDSRNADELDENDVDAASNSRKMTFGDVGATKTRFVSVSCPDP